jgi:hypothetical protein
VYRLEVRIFEPVPFRPGKLTTAPRHLASNR